MKPAVSKKKVELESLVVNLQYAFEKGLDLENRVIRLTDDIDDHHFDWFDTCLTALESLNRKAVTIRISSYGGNPDIALGIVGRMRNSKVTKINTEGYGVVMSAATAILAAGDNRKMSSLAQFMHHEASYAVEGRHSEIQHEVKIAQRLSEMWCLLMNELTGIPKQYWITRGVGKDYYLTPEQCLKLNIIDEIM